MSIFSREVGGLFPDAFGLDMSDLSLKLISLHDTGGFHALENYSSVDMPAGAIVDGDIHRPEIVREAVTKLLAKARPTKVKSRRVICSLPETKGFLRIISMPKIDESSMADAIQWEIEANIPLALDQVYYDWQILPINFSGDESKVSVLVLAVARETVDSFVSLLESCGLEVVALEAESLAQARALLSPDTDMNEAALIVDLGDRRTGFFITQGIAPCFTSSAPVSSQMITDAISKQLQVSFAEAEKIKRLQGLGSFSSKSPLYKAAEPILENIAVEIERSMNFYIENLGYAKEIKRIILCGGGSNLKGIAPFMTRRLGREVELGNPWTAANFHHELPEISRETSVSYSTSIGLALKGLRTYDYIR